MTDKSNQRLTPKLRFPEFAAKPEWKTKPLGDICDRIIEKVGETSLTPVSITAGYGFVSQVEKFGRDISGAQYKNYIWLRKGEFAYNKGNSKTFPQGCVSRLHEFEQAAAPNAFICFRLHDGYIPEYFEGLFEQNAHGSQLIKYITSSARSDGLLNISPNEFFSVALPIPPDVSEQEKIAECLCSLDELIDAEGRKLEALRTHKKGLMQNLFPRPGESRPRLRFPEFQNTADWEELEVGEVFKVTRGKVLAMPLVSDERTSDAPYPVYSSQTKNIGLAGYYSEYLFEDAITWTTDGANAGDVNYRPGKFYCTNVCGVLISESGFANACCAELLNRVTRQHVSYVGNPKLMNGVMAKIRIAFPPIAEQARIADIISSIDYLIVTQTQKVADLQTHKKSLMQQLFPSLEEDK